VVSSNTRADATEKITPTDIHDPFFPPSYTINLSLPPSQRYTHLAQDFAEELHDVTDIFRIIVASWGVPVFFVRLLCHIFLRRLYSKEETAELAGIAQAIKVEMYYLIAFNTFLDFFMGCTSGGARIQNEKRGAANGPQGERMLHFRTLDWGMDQLRKLVVKLDYVKDGQHVGTSIGYVGFVGILTAVKKDLSMSLNLRPNRNSTSFLPNLVFYFHLLLVVVGLRPSISSSLRHHFLSAQDVSLSELASKISTTPSTAAYITLSNGDRTIVMEKDHNSAQIRESSDFISVTNHDLALEAQEIDKVLPLNDKATMTLPFAPSLQEFVTESRQRKNRLHTLWARETTKRGSNTKRLKVVKKSSIIKWLETDPIRNECTHFALVMDPKLGSVLYLKRYLVPV
jgi:hypothetical protein